MRYTCKECVLQYNEPRVKNFELTHAACSPREVSVISEVTAMEGEDPEQPEDSLEQKPVEQDFCLESIQFTAPILVFFVWGTRRWEFLGS